MTTDSASQWMAIASLVVALAVLVFGAIQYRAVARKDYVDELSKRIDNCEKRHDASERAREECESERERLMRLNTELIMDLRRATDLRFYKDQPPLGEPS